MKEMGWSYQETMETPITTFMQVVDVLNTQAKKQEEQMKKAKRGKR